MSQIRSEGKIIINIKGFVVIEVLSVRSIDMRELKGLIAKETGLFYRHYRIFRNGVPVYSSVYSSEEEIFERADCITVIPNKSIFKYVNNACDNDACKIFSYQKLDEVKNEKEAKKLNVSIQKQAEIEKVAQKEEETKKSHEMFISNSFKLFCEKFKKKHLERRGEKAFPYTKYVASRDLRKFSLYNELNEKQVVEALQNLLRLSRNPLDKKFFETLKHEFINDLRPVIYTVKDNLECPLKYYNLELLERMKSAMMKTST